MQASVADRFNHDLKTLYVSKDSEFAFLEGLAKLYPYCQALHLLLANATEEHMQRAALYVPQRSTLYYFVHQPQMLEKSYEIGNIGNIDDPIVETKEHEKDPIVEYISSSKENTSPQHLDTEDDSTYTAIEERKQFNVSKYHDDTMPYTFLWWLNKTRQDYQKSQPTPPLANKVQPNNKPEVQVMDILDEFIRKNPQIQAGGNNSSIPNPAKENKAEDSAEDHSDFVSETLAQIYVEQMLYGKAIEAYQKLCLKFPEKKLYFVSLIEKLEKRLAKLNK